MPVHYHLPARRAELERDRAIDQSTDDDPYEENPLWLALTNLCNKVPGNHGGCHSAAHSLTIARLLVDHGARIGSGGRQRLFFDICGFYDDPGVVDLLEKAGVDLTWGEGDDTRGDLSSSDQNDAMTVAAGRGAEGIVISLVDRGWPISGAHYGSDLSDSLLHVAAYHGQAHLVKVLLQRGAVKDLHLRAKRMHFRDLPTTLDPDSFEGQAKAPRIRYDDTPLEYACRSPCPLESLGKTIEVLLDAGAAPSQAALENAVIRGFGLDILHSLFKPPVDIHGRCAFSSCYWWPKDVFETGFGSRNATLLHAAALQSNDITVAALFDLGVVNDIKDHLGRTALHWSVSALTGRRERPSPRSRLECVRLVLSKQADPDIQDHFQRAPLHYAALFKQASIFGLLVRSHANPNVADKDGATPLHYLAEPVDIWRQNDDLDIKKLASLLSSPNLKVDQKNHSGATALHVAATNASVPVVELLLLLGADPTITDGQGKTALHRASLRPQWQGSHEHDHLGGPGENDGDRMAARMKALLLDAGADQTIIDDHGQTAADIESQESLRLKRSRDEFLSGLPRSIGRGRGPSRSNLQYTLAMHVKANAEYWAHEERPAY
ncbi:uncharacterized protein E0L32_002900 [Thyridium curvatum]|uniref:Ankyrin repeat protein n=1 Tax=Thyridium curvatum TaxID=1093900 RepID=A0A507BK46_9PEZI|nr:uncharacterized protein E0L32_002900 [Thyridium curvatum]TPX17799.1 hypothetical protein E0L32_002900 [Thyridium curvatum]